MLDTQVSSRGNDVRPDHQEFAHGLKLAAIATLSAVVTATMVIGAGRALLPAPAAPDLAAQRTSLTLAALAAD